MIFQFTPKQLDREIRLVVALVSLIVDEVMGEGAGFAAIREALGDTASAAELHEFGQTRHPAMLPNVETLPFAQGVARLDAYVSRQQWDRSVPNEIASVERTLEHALPLDYRKGLEIERDSTKPVVSIEQDINDNLEVVMGYFYYGILPAILPRAAARLKVDRDELLTLAEIAVLAETKEANVIAAAHRKRFNTVEVEGRRMAEPKDVLAWLVAAGYLPTIRDPQPESTPDASEFMFVPLARDGTAFLPDVRSAGRYTIGAKGEETKVNDFFEALALLTAMPTPRWRRPNAAGNWGIVSGVAFERIPRERIEHMLRIVAAAGR